MCYAALPSHYVCEGWKANRSTTTVIKFFAKIYLTTATSKEWNHESLRFKCIKLWNRKNVLRLHEHVYQASSKLWILRSSGDSVYDHTVFAVLANVWPASDSRISLIPRLNTAQIVWLINFSGESVKEVLMFQPTQNRTCWLWKYCTIVSIHQCFETNIFSLKHLIYDVFYQTIYSSYSKYTKQEEYS